MSSTPLKSPSLGKNLRSITSLDEYKAAVKAHTWVLVEFWAHWCELCSEIGPAVKALAQEYPHVLFLQVEAEEVDEVSDQFDISVVPSFTLLQDGEPMDQVEGAHIASVTDLLTQYVTRDGQAAGPPAGAGPEGAAGATEGAAVALQQPAPEPFEGLTPALKQRIKRLMRSAPVVVFMKGTPAAPRCGFSRKTCEALTRIGVAFTSFDILQDPQVREGLKQMSEWPTYPQVFAGGEFVGGCDVILQLEASGELKEEIDALLEAVSTTRAALQAAQQQPPQLQRSTTAGPAAAADSAAAREGGAGTTPAAEQNGSAPAAAAAAAAETPEQLEQRVRGLIGSSPVMLFMKGTPAEPRCGFSRKVVAALQGVGQPFGAFDILGDEAVREALKVISDWPTYPQLYVDSELMGGCDIVLELAQSGELAGTIKEMLAVN